MSPDLNPIEHMWGILKRKVEKHHVSNIQQLRDVIMEEWKRMPATTCAALVNPMPRRIKADNNGAPTKYSGADLPIRQRLTALGPQKLNFISTFVGEGGSGHMSGR